MSVKTFNSKLTKLSSHFSCEKPTSEKPIHIAKNSKKPNLRPLYNSEEDYSTNTKRVNKKKKKKVEDDPYIADDEDEDYNSKKRRSANEGNRLVLKVVKQGDYQHKQSFDRNAGGLGDIEQDFFLPRNLTPFNTHNSEMMLKNGAKNQRQKDFDDDSWESDSDFYEDNDNHFENKTKTVERAKTKAVFEMPRKPLANYSKWSRWSKCSPKCVTRRFKKCRPHARQTCGNDIIREIAYCYTEGSFCEEWISSQISKIGELNTIETPKTTTKTPKVTRRTESPLTNSVSQNFYGSNSNTGSRKKQKQNPDFKPQNFQCGFPSIRNKNNDFALKIIGGKTSRRAAWPWQVAIKNRYKEAFCGGTLISPNWVLTGECQQGLMSKIN